MGGIRERVTITSFLGVAWLSACAEPMSAQECRTANWYARGLDDGMHGVSQDAFSGYARACSDHGVAADPRAWAAGRAAGFAQWVCSERRGYDAGSRGASLETDCAQREQGEGAVLDGYLRGLRDRKVRILNDVAALQSRGSAGMFREQAEAASAQFGQLRFAYYRTLALELEVTARMRGGAGASGGADVEAVRVIPWSPADHAALQHLFPGDPGARRAASMRLEAAGRKLKEAAWRAENRTRLEDIAARRGFKATMEQVEAEIDRVRDEQLAAILAGMEVVGGPRVVAFCFDLAGDPSYAMRLRTAALGVLARHVPEADAAARARGYALWERLHAEAAPQGGAP
jgi:hypothetical protein